MSNGDNRSQWGMFLHFSLLAGLVVPLAGWAAPLAIYFVKKDEDPSVAEHGPAVLNWIISAFIYSIIGGILTLVVIGIFVLIILGILSIVYPIIGGIKASNGEVWHYPGSIRFLK